MQPTVRLSPLDNLGKEARPLAIIAPLRKLLPVASVQ